MRMQHGFETVCMRDVDVGSTPRNHTACVCVCVCVCVFMFARAQFVNLQQLVSIHGVSCMLGYVYTAGSLFYMHACIGAHGSASILHACLHMFLVLLLFPIHRFMGQLYMSVTVESM